MHERGCEGSEGPRQDNRTSAAFHRVLSLKETSLLQLPTANSQLRNDLRVALGVGSWGLGVRRIKFVTPMRALVPITLSIVTLLAACGAKSEPPASAATGLVRRSREGGGPRFRARQRHVREALRVGGSRSRRCAVRLRQRWRSGRFLIQSGSLSGVGTRDSEARVRRFGQPALSQRPRDRWRRHSYAAVHGRDDSERHRHRWLWHGRRRGGFQQRRMGGPVPDEVRRCQSTPPEQRRWHVQ